MQISHTYSPEFLRRNYPLNNTNKNWNRIGKMGCGKARGAAKTHVTAAALHQETVYHTPKTRHLGNKEVREGQAYALLGGASHMELPTILNPECFLY